MDGAVPGVRVPWGGGECEFRPPAAGDAVCRLAPLGRILWCMAELLPGVGGVLPAAQDFGVTRRRDPWWVTPTGVFVGLSAFVIYSTWADFRFRLRAVSPPRRAAGTPAVRLRRSFGQLLFPQPCCLCEGSLEDPLRSPVCPECRDRLRPLAFPACRKCGLFFAPSTAPGICGECRIHKRAFRMAVSAAPYEDVFRKALLELKFRRREVLAELLAAPAVEAFRAAARDPEAATEGPVPAAVLPVPLPFWRGRRRGFNQSELLAAPVARALGIPLVRGALRRRSRPPQTSVSPSARRANVRKAFRVRRLPGELAGRPLLLVDDVFTTGSTVESAVRELLRAGAGPVDVLTVARSARLASS